MKRIIFDFCALVLLIPFAAVAQQDAKIPTDPQLRTGKLANGLTYFIRKNDKPKGRADFYLVQKTGSVLEDENQRGLAHFLEHMAFNGTVHFPANTLVSELEKKGIKFGYNINASTLYDQTVYNLVNIPVTSEGLRDTALLVLHDWSGFLLLDSVEIEKERGVVLEEWRTRSNGYLRMIENTIYPQIFRGSPYAHRLPIGTVDVLKNFKAQQLKDYYKKWYRPDLQGIIVVGDVDPVEVEGKIRKLFGNIPQPHNPAIREYFSVPGNQEPQVVTAFDPEIREAAVKIYWKANDYSAAEKSTVQYFKTGIIDHAIGSLMGTRLLKLVEKQPAPYTSATSFVDKFEITPNRAVLLQVIPGQQNDMLTAINAALAEVERARRYGFTAAEFDSYKKGALQLLGLDYANRNNKETFEYSRNYIPHFTRNEPVPSDEWIYETTRQVLETITMDTINAYVRRYLPDSNMVMIVQCPTKDSARVPREQQLASAWKQQRQANLEPYVDNPRDNSNEVMAVKPPAGGKIIKTELKAYGYKQWTLSNGAKVLFKNTQYPETKIVFYGFSPGGYSLVADRDLPSALALNGIVLQAKPVSGVDNRVSAVMRVDKYYETVSGRSFDPKDIGLMFRLIYLNMQGLRKDTLAFEKFTRSIKESMNNRAAEPKQIFGDTLESIMANHNPRAGLSLSDPATLSKVSYETVQRIYKERFSNAGDFTFFITGNISEDSVRPLVEKWIGGLPSVSAREKMKDHGMRPPKGIIKKHLAVPMQTPQTTVTVGYTGTLPFNAENRMLMECLSGILQIRYTETLREQEGGTYGAGVSGDMYKFPDDRFIFQVNFDTDPAKKEKMVKIVYDELDRIMKQGPDMETMNKVKGNLVKRYEDNSEKNAEYWGAKSWFLYVYGLDEGPGYNTIVSGITVDKLRSFANKILSQGNIIEVIMDPLNN